MCECCGKGMIHPAEHVHGPGHTHQTESTPTPAQDQKPQGCGAVVTVIEASGPAPKKA